MIRKDLLFCNSGYTDFKGPANLFTFLVNFLFYLWINHLVLYFLRLNVDITTTSLVKKKVIVVIHDTVFKNSLFDRNNCVLFFIISK